MKRFLTIAAVILFASSAMAQGTYTYGWTISSSIADPYVNTGTPPMGMITLYLWYACSLEEGMSAAEFDLSGTIVPFAANANAGAGWLNAGTATQLQLAIGGCPVGPSYAMMLFANDFGGFLDIVASSAWPTPVTVDCGVLADPTTHASDWIGYCSDGGPAHGTVTAETICVPVSVEDKTWGTIKSLYR